MKHLLLGLLLLGPQSLYDLHRRFEAGLTHIYAASYGSLHRALGRLVAEGYAELSGADPASRGRKTYALTGSGHQEWRRWMRAADSAEDLEVALLSRIFLLDLVESPADRAAILHAQRERVSVRAQRLEVVAAEAATGALGTSDSALATLDYGRRATALLAQWLEELLAKEAAR